MRITTLLCALALHLLLVLAATDSLAAVTTTIASPPSPTNATSISAAAHAAHIKECGDLGIMPIPAGADPTQYRRCLEHPAGPLEPSIIDMSASDRRGHKCAVHYGQSYGCTKGHCWKRCGANDQWCWTAFGAQGTGGWVTCDDGCRPDFACGKGCKGCGCECWRL